MDAVGSDVVEIACDESGFSGTNLLAAPTPVFTHASVDLRVDEAVELIRAMRSGFWRSRNEFKSGQFLRGPQAGEALEWFLAALGGRAHVHVVDKEYFLVTRIVDLFLAEPSYAAGTRLTQDHRPAALTLYRAGRAGGRDWSVFLAGFVELVRTKRQHHPDRSVVERFFQARDSLAGAGLGAEAEGVLDGLSRTQRKARFGDPEAPGGTHRFARQQATDNVESLLESRWTRPDVGAHCGESSLAPAEAALHDEGASSDGRQCTDLLSHQLRVP